MTQRHLPPCALSRNVGRFDFAPTPPNEKPGGISISPRTPLKRLKGKGAEAPPLCRRPKEMASADPAYTCGAWISLPK